MAPFDTETLASLREKLTTLQDPNADDNRRLYDGDHWYGGVYWVGPRPQTDDTHYGSVMLEIARAFISKNAVRETVARHMGAIVGQEPAWKLTVRRPLDKDEAPNAEEQTLIAEAEGALTVWGDARGMLGVLQDMVATLLLEGRASARLYVPPGLLDEAGRVPVGDLSASLDKIYLHHPRPMSAAVVTDQKTQRQAGIYLYQEEEDGIERPPTMERLAGIERAELVSLDDMGLTIIRILNGEDSAQAPLDLGGRLTIYEAARDVLITPQVRQLQALLNLALTMLGRNVVMGGFLERVILNAQMPGHYETVEGVERFIPDPVYWGAGTTNIINGAAITDQAGNVAGYAQPSYHREGPVDVATFLQTKEEAYRAILEETQQLHALIAGDATASGESRKQARADFESSLNDTTVQIGRAGRWLLETVLTMAAVFSGQPGRYDSLRAVFDPRIDVGPQSSEDVRMTQELAGGQPLLSVETAMGRIGVEDTAGELERLATEADTRAARAPAVVVAPSQDAPPMGDMKQ